MIVYVLLMSILIPSSLSGYGIKENTLNLLKGFWKRENIKSLYFLKDLHDQTDFDLEYFLDHFDINDNSSPFLIDSTGLLELAANEDVNKVPLGFVVSEHLNLELLQEFESNA